MATFKDKLFMGYPIPRQISIWSPLPGKPAVEDIDVLIETVVDELASDVLMTDHIEATGMITYMPEGTITCTSAMLSGIYPFQGNRLVKVTYDASSRKAFLRYYPAVITYSRKLRKEDLEILTGDRLMFFKAYCLWKMSEKELAVLKTANMNIDNGQIDFSTLEEFVRKQHEYYLKIKEEILIYATVN